MTESTGAAGLGAEVDVHGDVGGGDARELLGLVGGVGAARVRPTSSSARASRPA